MRDDEPDTTYEFSRRDIDTYLTALLIDIQLRGRTDGKLDDFLKAVDDFEAKGFNVRKYHRVKQELIAKHRPETR